jgi:uncharacterized protein DUF4862
MTHTGRPGPAEQPYGGIPGYVVGAYTATPTASGWDPALETDYYEALAADDRIGALELPWMGDLHAHDEEWLFTHLPAAFGTVLTDVAQAFLASRDNPGYGLASDDPEGRALALADAAALRDDARRLNDRLGRRAVHAVELHSAPRASAGSAKSLARSLTDIAGWDWDSADLVIEHVDALVAGHDPEKGFLSLGDEIEAIKASATDIGIALNWGRSALELRDPDRVTEHVTIARNAGLLRGCIFSGTSDQRGYFDRPWVDAHNMFRRSPAHPFGDPDSLLTDERVRTVAATAGTGAWLGVKLWWPPKLPGTVAERAAMIRHALDSLDAAQVRQP